MSDVILTEPAPRSIAAIGAYRAPILAALKAELGLTAPTTQNFTQSGGITLSCLSPTRYLATGARDLNLPARLATALESLAAITDQSDLWHYFILTGPAASETLSRLVPIDLSPKNFPPGALAQTLAGHQNIRLWHLADQTYELATPRSYAPDLRHDIQTLL
jgi:sarcosine oxidase subunit gamma